MFKNLMVYRLAAEWQADVAKIEEALEAGRFIPCGATQAQSVGWVPPRGIEHAPLVEAVDGHLLLKLMVEQRVLPGSVVKRRVDEMAAAEEAQSGRKPGRKALKEMKEFATQELLPLAFTKQGSLRVWIAPKQQLLMIDASSPSRAEEVVSLLVKALDGLSLHLIQTAESPAVCMAAWLMDSQPPHEFTIDRDCELKSGDEQKSAVRYARHALDIEEVKLHLQAGKQPTRLAMSWRDRVSFVLTDTLQLKKIAFLDLVFEGQDKPGKDEQFDADAALSTGELGDLIPALIEALGGEHDFFGSAPAPATLPVVVESKEPALEGAAPWD
ncbi:recombination-associated protein RdgC [Pelomonas sp. SE-A7]|uniref:recombination-associated protein RdgC n=1 Tax=Pelomonas sp. SE-A7 TaxID=3054953 RepID=UPI00259CB5DE|nr:recombination-associated protein RdgC [Pelomonas sp. SE-A7]MDM4765418.1 recombination-associated protein RdgC [Pelomonas sp. SE-A7]